MNELLHGNCLSIIPKLKHNFFQTICTDVPYFILNKENVTTDFHTDIIQFNEFDNFKTYEDYIQFIDQFVALIIPKMAQDSTFISFFATQYVTDLINIGKKYGLEYKNVLVWYKPNPMFRIRKTNFISSYESIVMLIKGNPLFFYKNQNEMHNCIIQPLISQKERIRFTKEDKKRIEDQLRSKLPPNSKKKIKISNSVHPTQKPIKLLKHLLSITTEPNANVCDPFAGIGSTNIACSQLGMNCVGIELDDLYFKYGQNRLEKGKVHQKQQTIFQIIDKEIKK